eukprot:359937-Chlamydomonas_euryale.AAC.32
MYHLCQILLRVHAYRRTHSVHACKVCSAVEVSWAQGTAGSIEQRAGSIEQKAQSIEHRAQSIEHREYTDGIWCADSACLQGWCGWGTELRTSQTRTHGQRRVQMDGSTYALTVVEAQKDGSTGLE